MPSTLAVENATRLSGRQLRFELMMSGIDPETLDSIFRGLQGVDLPAGTEIHGDAVPSRRLEAPDDAKRAGPQTVVLPQTGKLNCTPGRQGF